MNIYAKTIYKKVENIFTSRKICNKIENVQRKVFSEEGKI